MTNRTTDPDSILPLSPYDANDADPASDDLWFLSGHIEGGPDDLPTEPLADAGETAVIADWRQAEQAAAAYLARVAGRLGALDDRLRRGPDGWRHRLALLEAADLSWVLGDRITPDRLALWTALRLSGVQDDTAALARAAWAARRLTGGPGPEAGLAEFLGRHDPEHLAGEADRWLGVMAAARDLHPITRACMGYHLWALAGLGHHGDRIEAAVTAARIAAGDGQGAVLAPLIMGGAGGLHAGGPPADRLLAWRDGMERAIPAAMRHLDSVEAWAAYAETAMAPLSGHTPPALLAVLPAWPFVSAPMAETLTGASCAAVQRNLTWMQARGLIREVTGQGRFRMWKAAI